MTTLAHAVADSSTMLRRELRHTARNPSTLVMSVLLPGVLLLLLNFGFGGAIRTGGGRYVDFLTPGIIMMAACYAVSATSVAVATDSSEGIIDRFRTMAIARAAVLTGHVIGSLLQILAVLVLVILVSIALGFRPTANPLEWVAALAVLGLFSFALIWLSTALGLAAKSVETASNTPMFLTLLPFLSSGFVLTATLPVGLRQFAEYQPFTSVTQTVRGLLVGGPVGSHAVAAIAWSIGIAVACYIWSIRLYDRRRAAAAS